MFKTFMEMEIVANKMLQMEVDVNKGRSPRPSRRSCVQPCAAPPPEVELYIHLLVLLHLVDQKKLDEAEKVLHLFF